MHVGHPVGCEQNLVLPCDRAFKPDHRVDPRGKFRLGTKLRIRKILTPAVSDSIVDDQDLAVIAQIHTRPQGSQGCATYRQSDCGFDSGVLHGAPKRRTNDIARTESIGHHPADDPAFGRSAKGFDHLRAAVVGKPNVEIQMHMFFGPIDVTDHRVDRDAGVGHQIGAVSADGLKPIDGESDSKHMIKAGVAQGLNLPNGHSWNILRMRKSF